MLRLVFAKNNFKTYIFKQTLIFVLCYTLEVLYSKIGDNSLFCKAPLEHLIFGAIEIATELLVVTWQIIVAVAVLLLMLLLLKLFCHLLLEQLFFSFLDFEQLGSSAVVP